MKRPIQPPLSPGSAHPLAEAVSIAPEGWEVMALAFQLVCASLLYWTRQYGLTAIASPACLMIIMGTANWRMVRRDPKSIWTPLFAFRLASAVFIGLGSLVPYLIDPIQLERMLVLYAYSDAEAAKVLLVWMLYIGVIIVSAKLASLVLGDAPDSWLGKELTWLDSGTLGIIFIVVGTAYSVVIDLSFAMGIFSFVLPGTISTIFQAVNAVGLFLVALTTFTRRGWWWVLLIGVLVLSVLLSLILYNKSGVLFPILLVGIAVLIRRVTVLRITAVATSLFLVLSILQPSIEDARIRHELIFGPGEGGGTAPAGTLLERLGNVTAYWTEGPVNPEGLGQGITRLSYLNIGTYLVAEYDLGVGGNTMSGALAALVPRFVWPDKPIVTDVGRELHERIFGAAVSFIAPTTAADIYWNYGWTGVLLLSPVIGIILWVGTLAAGVAVRREDWFMMPFVLLAFRTALGLDQAFVVGVFVPTVFTIILFYALRAIKDLLALREQRQTTLGQPRFR